MSGSGFLQRNFILETYFTWKSLRLPRSRERCAGDEAGAEALRHRDVVCFGGGGWWTRYRSRLMSSPGSWIRKFLGGSISRREFVERAAYGGLSISATTAVLGIRSRARAQEGPGGQHRSDHHHFDAANQVPTRPMKTPTSIG
jgi:hypothetical protein